ncbi:MAG: hypothetical protein L6246_07420 [Thermodesulfovibrionales bacterium]|nr:hypothetical protein [Thermodesulfovibrionales bacterium]MCG2813444.1 hypothetical protein [Thermodesulfovibrionales bacterium]
MQTGHGPYGLLATTPSRFPFPTISRNQGGNRYVIELFQCSFELAYIKVDEKHAHPNRYIKREKQDVEFRAE